MPGTFVRTTSQARLTPKIVANAVLPMLATSVLDIAESMTGSVNDLTKLDKVKTPAVPQSSVNKLLDKIVITGMSMIKQTSQLAIP